MFLAYMGRYAAVHVPALGQVVKRNEPIEINDKITAETLKRQGWREFKKEGGRK